MSFFRPVLTTLTEASSHLLSPLVGTPNNDATNGTPNAMHSEFVPMTEMVSSTEQQMQDSDRTKTLANIGQPCDVCLIENTQIVFSSHCCQNCQLALCEHHLNKHRNDSKTKNHVIVNGPLLHEKNLDYEIEIVSTRQIHERSPMNHNNVNKSQQEDAFEHHQLIFSSDSNNLDINNLTDEEEDLLALNQQDFIYWTNLLKKYPHFCNLIHTPLIVRKLYHNGTLTGSLLIDNKTSHTINVILSQVGPLHQLIIPPGRLGIFEGIGRVHFTIEVGPFDISRDKIISNWDKALPIVGSVCAGVAAGVGLAAGALAGVGLIGIGAAAAFGGVSTGVTIATAPIVAGVAKTTTEKKQQQQESSLPHNDENYTNNQFSQSPSFSDDVSSSTSSSSSSSTSSKDPESSKFKHWMKKIVPGMNWTYPNCFKRGIFADGHSLIVIKQDQEESTHDHAIFEIEERRIT
ncbi:hypothetical protein C9374_011627 [Naegleria lovaniensis]|uniref:Uncharacterized protein n=1 Tax=Naegleria lovaniensis TaxID=51637 RepID=A0AA88GE72_NAELO|nr:uncharacterized protein C9374_011627 [Naegleria lovaniensis]KAG2373962.1 hypothetical protein C9374_011627 [Naegleria lovaniensis]